MPRIPPQNTRFKPGQSGNPNGRPKRLNDQDLLKTLQQIITLYADAQSKDKVICLPAHRKLKQVKETLFKLII